MSLPVTLPFDAYQLAMLVVFGATVVAGYTELKIGFRNYKVVADAKLKMLGEDVELLKADRTGIALLAQSVQNLATDVRDLKEELKADRYAREKADRTLTRVAERLHMEIEK